MTKLIAASADVNKARTSDGCTPLYFAANNGHTAIVSKLLQHGADKSIRGWQNETPLEAAQRNNHAAIVALLA
jgi:ankyrin repeat protein